MNKLHKFLYILIAGGLGMLAFAEFTGLFLPYPIMGEATLIVTVIAGLTLIVVRDYSRRIVFLKPAAEFSRPARPVRATRRAAAIVERAA